MRRISAKNTIMMVGTGFALAACTTTAATDTSVEAAAAGTSTTASASTSTSTSTTTAATPGAPVEIARALMNDAYGRAMGTVIFYDYGADISVRAGLSGQPGSYALHVHTTGKCDAPDFATAGGHWNPANKQHGTQNPAGSHKGDLPNISFGADGTGTLEFRILGVTPAQLLDADGAAVVMHEKVDDNMSDPAGNAGARIGCGVVTAV